MQINEKKICFILCVNNERLWEECELYLTRLIVPKGYTIDVLTVHDASSMTSGYNEAMISTDAKYKVYMHQDVFITDIHFLEELIEIFELNDAIGMVGIVGVNNMPQDGVMWHGERVSALYGMVNATEDDKYIKATSDNIAIVEAVDGLMIATQYDIEWREDLFKDWDFYDASQSFEFRKKGYMIAVPLFNKAICVHDDGYVLDLSNYEKNRKLFVEEYREMLE